MVIYNNANHKSTAAKSVQPHSLLAKWFLLEQATINSDLSSSEKAVLAALLFHHNTKTGRVFVGEETIAAGKHTAHIGLRLSTRQVKRCIRELKVKGWIVAERRFNKSSEYEFNWSRAVPVDKKRQSDGDTDVPSVGDMDVRDRGHGCHPMGTLVSFNGDMDVPLTDIGTDIRTDIKNTHSESVCFSAASSDETKVQVNDSDLTGKEVPHGGSELSLRAAPCPSPSARDATGLSDERDTNLTGEENPFVHLAKEGSYLSEEEESIPSLKKGTDLSEEDKKIWVRLESSSSQEEYISSSSQTNNIPSCPFGYEFSEFWRVFPPEKRFNEKAAYKAFVDAVKNKNVDAKTLAIAANGYKNFCKWNLHQPEDKRYISQPDTWLRNERWLDTSRQLLISNDPERPFVANEPPARVAPDEQLTVESAGLAEEDLNNLREEELNSLRSRKTDLEQLYEGEHNKWWNP